jgi:hypothetical protein
VLTERYDYADFGAPAFFDGSGSAIPGSAVGNVYLFGGMEYDSESGLYVPGSFDPRVATYSRVSPTVPIRLHTSTHVASSIRIARQLSWYVGDRVIWGRWDGDY